MNVKNLSIVLLSSFLFSGCFSFGLFDEVKPIQIKAIPLERVKLDIQSDDPLKPKTIKWFVITPENYEKVFAELEKGKYDLVLYGLTDEDYQNLSINLAQLRKYMIKQTAIIKAYKDYYEPPEKVKED